MSSYPKTPHNQPIFITRRGMYEQAEEGFDRINQRLDQIEQRIDPELDTTTTRPQMPIGTPQPPLGRNSSQMTCPYCSEEIWTQVETKRGLWNWLACLGLCIPLTMFLYV